MPVGAGRQQRPLDRLEQLVRQSFWSSSAAFLELFSRRSASPLATLDRLEQFVLQRATRCARCAQFRQGIASRSFLGREATHSPRRDQDPSAARGRQEFWQNLGGRWTRRTPLFKIGPNPLFKIERNPLFKTGRTPRLRSGETRCSRPQLRACCRRVPAGMARAITP